MKQKILNTLENGFYLLALFAITSISVVGVIALNPTSESEPTVAGITTQISEQVSVVPPLVELSANSLGTNLEKRGEGAYILTKSLERLLAGKASFPNILKIKNLNSFEIKIKFNPLLVGQVSDLLKVEIYDILDVITLVSAQQLFLREITIPANSMREFSIAIETQENINFPFGFILEIK